MTFKESFYALMNFEKPDLLVQFEWDYWSETIERWHEEGLSPGKEPWEDLNITCYERAPVKLGFDPEFEEKVLEQDAESEIIQNSNGVILKRSKKRTNFPQFLKHPVQNRDDFERIKERLNPHSEGRCPSDWNEKVWELENGDTVSIGEEDSRWILKYLTLIV